MDARITSGKSRLNDAIDLLNSLEKLSLLVKGVNMTWYPGKNGLATDTDFIDSVELLHSIEDVGFRTRESGTSVIFIRAVVL